MHKKIILILIAIFSYNFKSYCQYVQKKRKVITIVQERSIYLNGKLRASIGGDDKTIITFDLPFNTVEWYYTFSTKKGGSGVEALNLSMQLSALFADPTKITGDALNRIRVPQGESSINTRLLDYNNMNYFIQGNMYNYFTQGSVDNTMQAKVKVNDILRGKWFLGLENTSTLDGVNISIEITAVVEVDNFVNEWTNENKQRLKADCLQRFNIENKGKYEVCNCYVNNITQNNKPKEWTNLSHQVLEINKRNTLNECSIEINGTDLQGLQKEKQEKALKELSNQIQNIVEQQKPLDEWTPYKIDQIKINCLKNFGTNSAGKDEVCNCFAKKIIKDYLPSEWSKLSKISNRSVQKTFIEKCYTETNNLELKENEEIYWAKINAEKKELDTKIAELNELVKEAEAANILGNKKEAKEKLILAFEKIQSDIKLEKNIDKKTMANQCNSIAWHSILLNELEDAEKYLQKGFRYNSGNMYLRGNLGLLHLIRGDYYNAEKAFLFYKRNTKLPDGRKWRDVIQEDLIILERQGMGTLDFDKIRTLLKIKK